jgi:hypothetical protein
MRVLATLFLLLCCSATAQQFQTEPYIEDFHQLLSEMSVHYANLEWVALDRRTDLPKLKARTEERLRNARSDEEAHRAFTRFINALGDGHLEIQWPRPSASRQSSAAPEQSFCERMGYDQQDNDGGVDWASFPGFKPVQDADAADFPGGLLVLKGTTIGVVRIGLFSEHSHMALCHQAQKKLAKADDAQCTDACEDDFEFAVADLLTAALERRLKSLRAAGATHILIDITGNGGGTNWVQPAARVMTQIPLKSPRIAFVKSDHWVKDMQGRLDEINADTPRAFDAAPAVLIHATDAIRDALVHAQPDCDRAPIWIGAALNCSQIYKPKLFTSGTLAYAKPGSFPKLKSRYVLFDPLHYHYHEGVNQLPVIVLVDNNTASSAEYFAAILQDNHAATIVGVVTNGCGCGFTNGGIPTTLKNSRASVRLPDCIRLRADGSNEVAGITPDFLVPWPEQTTPYQRGAIFKTWLDTPDGQKLLHK